VCTGSKESCYKLTTPVLLLSAAFRKSKSKIEFARFAIFAFLKPISHEHKNSNCVTLENCSPWKKPSIKVSFRLRNFILFINKFFNKMFFHIAKNFLHKLSPEGTCGVVLR